jgi:alkylation response protein AidB-like acyl-CoA dehydrogenase
VTTVSEHASRSSAARAAGLDEPEFAALQEEIRAYVEDQGERWAQRIERERAVPLELWDELRDRGYLRLAAPVQYGGRGIPLSRYLELLEILSMSHGSLRMIVHVCNGIWRPIAAHATEQQRQRFLVPLVAGTIKVAFALTEPTAGTGADLRCEVARDGDTYYVSGEKHLITFGTIADYLLLIAGADGSAPRRGGRRDGDARVARDPRHRSRTARVRARPGSGRPPAGRRRRGARRRARRLSGPEPDLAGDDLRGAGAARTRVGRRLRQAP